MNDMGVYMCDHCRWYKPNMRELTHDEKEFQRLAKKYLHQIYSFETRACIMGGCDGQSKFERVE